MLRCFIFSALLLHFSVCITPRSSSFKLEIFAFIDGSESFGQNKTFQENILQAIEDVGSAFNNQSTPLKFGIVWGYHNDKTKKSEAVIVGDLEPLGKSIASLQQFMDSLPPHPLTKTNVTSRKRYKFRGLNDAIFLFRHYPSSKTTFRFYLFLGSDGVSTWEWDLVSQILQKLQKRSSRCTKAYRVIYPAPSTKDMQGEWPLFSATVGGEQIDILRKAMLDDYQACSVIAKEMANQPSDERANLHHTTVEPKISLNQSVISNDQDRNKTPSNPESPKDEKLWTTEFGSIGGRNSTEGKAGTGGNFSSTQGASWLTSIKEGFGHNKAIQSTKMIHTTQSQQSQKATKNETFRPTSLEHDHGPHSLSQSTSTEGTFVTKSKPPQKTTENGTFSTTHTEEDLGFLGELHSTEAKPEPTSGFASSSTSFSSKMIWENNPSTAPNAKRDSEPNRIKSGDRFVNEQRSEQEKTETTQPIGLYVGIGVLILIGIGTVATIAGIVHRSRKRRSLTLNHSVEQRDSLNTDSQRVPDSSVEPNDVLSSAGEPDR